MNEKRYYWLKLEENYFDLKVQKALRKLPSGSDMLICYLKMQLKYLNKGGLIEYQGIYNELSEEIALDIDEEVGLVKMTLTVLEKWNVIEQCTTGLYINEMQGRIGSKTDTALRVAKHRQKEKMLHCNDGETKCNSIQEIDIEKDIEKDIDIDINNGSSNSSRENKDVKLANYIEQNFGRTISPIEFEKIEYWKTQFNEELLKHAIDLSILNNKKTFSYIDGILNNWKIAGYKTISDIKGKNESRTSSNIEHTDNGFKINGVEYFDYDWMNDDCKK